MDGTASCKVIYAGSIAAKILNEVSRGLSRISKRPLLVGFLANDDPAALLYARWTEQTCTEKSVHPYRCSSYPLLTRLWNILIPTNWL